VEDLVAPADRRRLIRALGIVQIVLGCLCGIGALADLAVVLTSGGGPILVSAIYAIPAANLLTTGIGSYTIAQWARRATLISAFVWLGLIGVAATLMRGELAGMTYERWLAGAFVIVALALAILSIVGYTRPSVRATFERRQPG